MQLKIRPNSNDSCNQNKTIQSQASNEVVGQYCYVMLGEIFLFPAQLIIQRPNLVLTSNDGSTSLPFLNQVIIGDGVPVYSQKIIKTEF